MKPKKLKVVQKPLVGIRIEFEDGWATQVYVADPMKTAKEYKGKYGDNYKEASFLPGYGEATENAAQ